MPLARVSLSEWCGPLDTGVLLVRLGADLTKKQVVFVESKSTMNVKFSIGYCTYSPYFVSYANVIGLRYCGSISTCSPV